MESDSRYLCGYYRLCAKLFTIIVIWYAVKYLVRLVLYLAREVEAGRLKINGFYPDWAMPTFHIARFLLYAFMIAMIYPYLRVPIPECSKVFGICRIDCFARIKYGYCKYHRWIGYHLYASV